MDEEFNLSKRRREMFEWIKTQYDDKFGLDLIALIIDRIMQDDAEFIKLLKDDLCKEMIERPQAHWASLDRIFQRDIMETIDALAGEDLI